MITMDDTKDIKKRMRELLDFTMGVLDAERGFLLIFDGLGNGARLRAWVGAPGAPDLEEKTPPDFVTDASLEVRGGAEPVAGKVRERDGGGPDGAGGSYIEVPLRVRGGTAGALVMERGSVGRRFKDSDLEKIQDALAVFEVEVENLFLNLEMEKRGKLHRMLLSKMISAQEDERKRIAGDIHDDTVQSLISSFYRLEGVDVLIEQGRLEEAREDLGKVRAGLQRDIAGMRRLLFDLRPSVLDDAGVASAIEDILNRLEDELPMTCVLHVEEGLGRLEPALEVTLYRLSQEILTNVRKHSKATRVEVSISSRAGTIEMSVRDNGAGFDIEDVLNEAVYDEHFGLRSLIERAELAGGEVEIDTCPGKGTEVKVLVPASTWINR